MTTLTEIIQENARRIALMQGDFDPISGKGSIGPRVEVVITGLPEAHQWIPAAMRDDDVVSDLVAAGSVSAYCLRHNDMDQESVRQYWERLRCLHDFAYWAAKYVYIKKKGGGEDVLFRLTYPQRKLVEVFEADRVAARPIRIIMLKARQWGGSTTSQLYMAWLQLVHSKGLNSLIIAHQCAASDEIRDMFDRMIKSYPVAMLHDPDETFSPAEKVKENVGRTGNCFRVIQRNCKVKIGTAERPDSCRGGDYNLVHLSEVGLWRATDGKNPGDIVRSACSGILYQPLTMIVYESTANGVGNFFHKEYMAAKDGSNSHFRSVFIPWYEIEHNTLPFRDEKEREAFALRLVEQRHEEAAKTNRCESGRYLWWLWQKGATLEGINWYISERQKHSDHGSMAAECPTDDTEAFVNSGASVFDKYKVEAFRGDCRKPLYIGDITGDDIGGVCGVVVDRRTALARLSSLRFVEDACGRLAVWKLPDSDNNIENRYLAVVDIGGRSAKSDWSVVAVFDRKPMIEGGAPEIVAQWYGHQDMDQLAWKAAQIAAFYDNALLVVESNTLETHDPERYTEGDQSHYILNEIRSVYDNLYARKQSAEDIMQGRPCKYGFHTNIATKPMIISTLVKVVRDHLYTERDERCLDEYLVYERRANGSYGAIPGSHDDLLMTRAIGLHICFCEMEPPRRSRYNNIYYPSHLSEASF